MDDKAYLLHAVKIIDLLIERKRVSSNDGMEISGDYWFFDKECLA